MPVGLVPVQTVSEVAVAGALGVYPSADRTAAPTLVDLDNYSAKGVVVFINVSAVGAPGGTVTVTVQGKDQISGNYFTILASVGLGGVAFTKLTVDPTMAASANSIAKFIIPRKWRILVEHTDTNHITYSIGASLV